MNETKVGSQGTAGGESKESAGTAQARRAALARLCVLSANPLYSASGLVQWQSELAAARADLAAIANVEGRQ